MKKLALSSLVAVFAVSAANANVIDDNPLYMPKSGHFYSITDVNSSTDHATAVALGEEFGYGITDRFMVNVKTSLSQDDWFDDADWNNMGMGLTLRVIDDAFWKLDAVAEYAVGPVLYDQHKSFLKGSFLNKNHTNYTWTAGVRGGYVAHNFTIAGHVLMDYMNTKSFNWDDYDASLHVLRAGIDAQMALTRRWNLVYAAEYSKSMDHYNETRGNWELGFGANFNIDPSKFVGIYLTKDINHEAAQGDWKIEDGFGFGAKFGVDF